MEKKENLTRYSQTLIQLLTDTLLMVQKTLIHKSGQPYKPPGASTVQRQSYPSEYEDTFEEIPEADLEDEEEKDMGGLEDDDDVG